MPVAQHAICARLAQSYAQQLKNKEESPYKPDPVLLRGITIHLDL
jgi:hypothetical protein